MGYLILTTDALTRHSRRFDRLKALSEAEGQPKQGR